MERFSSLVLMSVPHRPRGATSPMAAMTSPGHLGMTPHVASREKGSRIDGRTTNHLGYEISQRKRKRVEEPFGWMKTFGLLRKLRHRGEPKVDWLFRFTATAYNITRLHGLTA